MANVYKDIDNLLKILPISDYKRKKLRNSIIIFVLKWGIIIGLPMAVIGGIAEKMGFIEPKTKQEVKAEAKEPLISKKIEQVQQLSRELKPQVQVPQVQVEKPSLQIQQSSVETKPQVQTTTPATVLDTSSGIVAKRPETSTPNISLADLKFLDGLAVFEDPNTGLKGYVNGDGKIVIKPQFTGAGGFYQGRAVVKNAQELWGYIDKSGNWVLSPQFCMAGRFSEGLAAVYVGGYRTETGDCLGGKWGYVASSGKMVIAPQFEQATYFSKNTKGIAVAKVTLDGYSGYINSKAEWVDIKPKAETNIDTASSINVKLPDTTSPNITLADLKFLDGLAVFEDPNTGLKGYVNGDGKTVIKPQFTGAGGFYQGRAVVKNAQELWGYIDKSGNWVLSPQFCMAGRFSEGLAAVYVGGYRTETGDCLGGKWGYVASSGKMVIAPQFEQATYFSKNTKGVAVAKVTLDGYSDYINGKVEWVN